MADRKDYSGPFDPDFRYEDLSKEALVRLVREYALIVHLLDRSMCAAIGIRFGPDMVNELAIEEWRGASPIYGERLREIMGVEGDGVEAIFKVLQLDPGFPHHYMDVHYEVVDDHLGYFELRSCGAANLQCNTASCSRWHAVERDEITRRANNAAKALHRASLFFLGSAAGSAAGSRSWLRGRHQHSLHVQYVQYVQ